MAGFRKAADRTLVGRSGPICNSLSVQLVGRLAQWLARLLYTQLVGGSSPSSPTTFFQRSTRRSPWRWPSANPPGPLPQCIPKLLVSAHEQLFSGYNADVRRYGKQRSNTAARSADVPVRSEVRPGQRAGIDPHRTASHRIAPHRTARHRAAPGEGALRWGFADCGRPGRSRNRILQRPWASPPLPRRCPGGEAVQLGFWASCLHKFGGGTVPVSVANATGVLPPPAPSLRAPDAAPARKTSRGQDRPPGLASGADKQLTNSLN